MTKLRLAKELDLPLEAVTQKLAWLGRTGSGKTFACKRMVEQMLHAGAQVIILDGAGVWPGLRLGPKRFDIPVLGGLYGDIPLESTAGALVADVIVNSRTSMVLDVSQMLDAERTRFATAFGQQFFQRKKASPGAVHLVLEECQDFVPENHQRGEERMLHEFQRLAKQGRSHGIGMSLISQRPQEISKKALNQVECVFAFQMTGAHERKALQYWLNDRGAPEKLEDLLPRLEIGAPHVWSPQWLKISRVVHILPIETLDTSRTPKVGEKAFTQKKLEPIDLKELTAAMAETVERAKADDPHELKRRITDLEKELTKKTSASDTKKLETHEVIVDGRHLKEIIDAAEMFEKGAKDFDNHLRDLRAIASIANNTVRRARQTGPAALAKRLDKMPEAVSPKPRPPGDRTPPMHKKTPDGLPKGEHAILVAVAQHPDGVTRAQLTVLTGYKRSSRDAYLQRLSSGGYVEPHVEDRIVATPLGLQELGPDFEPLPTGRALLEHWFTKLPKGEREILWFVDSKYPNQVSRTLIDDCTGYKRSSRDAYLQRLATRGLVKITRDGDVILSETLT